MIIIQNIIDSTYHYQPSWIMISIVLSVMIVGYLYSAFNTRFVELIKAFFAMRFTGQGSREEYSLTHPVSVLLSVNFFIMCPLFILQMMSSEHIFSSLSEVNFVSFLVVIFVVFTLYLFKIIFLRILGFIFDKQQETGEYMATIFLVNQLIGIIFIPVNTLIAYGSNLFAAIFIYAGITMIILAFFVKVGKGTIGALSSGMITPFYLLLYLCTLEILPLLLGYKLIEKLI